MIDPELLYILCCPLSRQPLRHASADELKLIALDLEEALIREDGRMLYPVRNGIPLLVPGEAIPIRQEPSPQ